MQTEQETDVKYIHKDNAVFTKTPGGFVALAFDGEEYERVKLFRMFPFTEENKYISVRMHDEKAQEIGVIEDLACLTQEAQDMIREQLEIRYFVPIIQKINNIKNEYRFAYFDVDTDKGACKFAVAMSSSSVVRLSATRFLFLDIDGNRFEIPDLTKLTAEELKKIDIFI